MTSVFFEDYPSKYFSHFKITFAQLFLSYEYNFFIWIIKVFLNDFYHYYYCLNPNCILPSLLFFQYLFPPPLCAPLPNPFLPISIQKKGRLPMDIDQAWYNKLQ